MKIELELSDAQLEILGKVIARTFNLRKTKDGLFRTNQGLKSYKGIASIMEQTVGETFGKSPEELQKMYE